jgi:hypothetical protein
MNEDEPRAMPLTWRLGQLIALGTAGLCLLSAAVLAAGDLIVGGSPVADIGLAIPRGIEAGLVLLAWHLLRSAPRPAIGRALLSALLLVISLAPGALATFVTGFLGADSTGAMQQAAVVSLSIGFGAMLAALLAALLGLTGMRRQPVAA